MAECFQHQERPDFPECQPGMENPWWLDSIHRIDVGTQERPNKTLQRIRRSLLLRRFLCPLLMRQKLKRKRRIMTVQPDIELAIRNTEANPNHHLWNNNGTWFVHYTVYPDPVTAERRRHSLKTRDVYEARERRDQLFRQLAA